MKNSEQKKYFSIGSFLGLILCIFASFIIGYLMNFVMDISNSEAFVPALVFVYINLVIITIVVSCGKAIINSLSVPTFIQIAFATFVYSLFQFIYMFITVNNASLEGYILYHIFIIFVYFIVILPVIIMGINNKNDKKSN